MHFKSFFPGIILSGNEISQILLSLILSYIGGQRNRPRWIAWGIVFCGLSCFILALPHFIYGAGQDALELTKEYYENAGGDNVTISLVVGEHNKTLFLINIYFHPKIVSHTNFIQNLNLYLLFS